MATHVARIRESHVAPIRKRSATIIQFPVRASVPPVEVERPNTENGSDVLGLTIVLGIFLILACVLWEALSAPSIMNDIAGRSAITSPRADIGASVLDGIRGLA